MSEKIATKQISARLDENKIEALENFRWDPSRRLTMPDILVAAVDLYIEANGITVEPVEDTPERD